MPTLPRRFHLQRHHDPTGVSGTGIVAVGVQWPDRTATVRWLGTRPSTVHWDCIDDAEHVHGHGGATEIVWHDEEQPAVPAQRGTSTATPCSQPDPCEDGELCATHEEEQAHAEGEHAFCGPTCEVEFPSDKLRNTILYRAIPGSARMLDELLRRAAVRSEGAAR